MVITFSHSKVCHQKQYIRFKCIHAVISQTIKTTNSREIVKQYDLFLCHKIIHFHSICFVCSKLQFKIYMCSKSEYILIICWSNEIKFLCLQ